MTQARLGPLIIDVEGLALTAEERERLAHPWVGGVILFARNFTDKAQLAALTHEIHAIRPGLAGPQDEVRLKISVDHEGGRIQRFRDGFTALPSFRSLTESLAITADGRVNVVDLERCLAHARRVAFTLASELKAVGVDFSYTPVLDLDHGRSQVISDRSFHRDPHVVALLAAATISGLRQAGFAHCGKHFPGHGWASADSHQDLPVDERSLEEVLDDDALPYGSLSEELTAIMPAHVRFSQVDQMPAGFSRIWLQEVLRTRLGFRGVIISDDLSMAGAEVLEDVVDRAQAAFLAGCDATLICNRPDFAIRVIDELPARMPDFLHSTVRRSLECLLPR